MSHIFISYSHLDKAYAHKLHRHLIDQGFDAWIDDRIDYGSRWPREIEKRLRDCVAFVLIMSPNSDESEWVQNELSLARQLHKPIFPLLLNGNVWWHLQTTQYVDVTGGKLPPTKFFVRLAEVAPRDQDIQPSTKDEPKERSSGGIGVGGNVSGSVIVQGNGNTINLGKQEEPARESPSPFGRGDRGEVSKSPEPKIDKPVDSKKLKPSRKMNMPLWIAIIGAAATILAAIISSAPQLFKPASLPTSTPLPLSTETSAPMPTETLTPQLTQTPIPPTQTPIPPTPTLGIGSTMISDKDGMTLIYVPAGNFIMGSNNGNADEQPVHTVTLDAFWIDRTDVTNAMYAKCMQDGKCSQPSNTDHYNNPNYANHPVVYVSWNNAQTYCSWAGRQLPTETQWEKAARGTDGRTYPWGNSAPDNTLLNYNSAVGDTTEVGKYPNGVSPYGVLDMAGNVWQWVADWYDAYPGNTTSNSDYGTKFKVLRGGSWYGSEINVRSALRYWYVPDFTDLYIGFRCALSQ